MSELVKVWEVMMTDHFEYEVPEEVPELVWAENEARFKHVGNGVEAGVWEFMLTVYQGDDPNGIPERLRPIFDEARKQGCDWIMFHQ